ncbi:hypothetical protein GGR56DRAFT_638177 [Xylariaceae sp. FL0804]|nr:hypothetical protein GGR56DRAFT_638177 [Xylariaceae sp. FL0804]
MTIDTSRSLETGPGHHTLEADILAALWEQVPFPRLPLDAPSEIRDLVVNIENPRRVYAIHCASRRHNIQLLVERFIVQLRYGCDEPNCSTPSCFTCRRRLAGQSPIRRYNPTSARTLAVYLASQDNPESRLCPHLQTPTRPTDALKPLRIFGPKCGGAANSTKKSLPTPKKPPPSPDCPRSRSIPQSPGPRHTGQKHDRSHEGNLQRPESSPRPSNPSSLHISEKATSKDYRSFAANVFGSVAYKMLEWLTPNSIESMSEHMEEARTTSKCSENGWAATHSSDDESDGLFVRSSSSRDTVNRHIPNQDTARECRDSVSGAALTGDIAQSDAARAPGRTLATDLPSHRIAHARKNSNATIRTSSGPVPQSRYAKDPKSNEENGVVVKSPTVSAVQPETVSKGFVRPPSKMRPASQLSSDDLHNLPDDQQTAELTARASHVDGHYPQLDGVNGGEVSSNSDTLESQDVAVRVSGSGTALEPPSELDSYLPQSLSRLNLQAINFICDILQEDATSERHMLSPSAIHGPEKRSPSQQKPWRRKRKSRVPYPHDLKLQWKLFVEQSIFNVLSDPEAVLESFTSSDGAMDSQTLWYCMLRLTRVAPSLVFDSLWIALAGLFVAPRSLQSTRSPAAKVFSTPRKSFSNAEAARLMSVCFHALIAAAPLVTDSRQLNNMSRVRSQGLSLTGGGSVVKPPTSLCLQYEDAFADESALRLARRLLMAIPTRRGFNELVGLDLDTDETTAEPDVLETMLSHIEPSTQAPSMFSKAERDLHEKRVPILLLDWARAIMINEWEGTPDVSGDGPLGGALHLIEAMYRKRQSLLLGMTLFRSEYFGDRLDTIQMPVSWLSFTSTRRKTHLLDHPYMFNPASLVSYFRAVNFSRMSRSYEESSSLQSRIKAIIHPDSLVTEEHHRNMLQDLLKTPAAKYLILDISRDDVLTDAFDQLWRREERELLRPLKVHLGEDGGEEGFDSGGVQQEFFRLALAEALNPDYGAFTVDDRTRMAWFQPGSLLPEWKFELLGLLMSLAVYNGLTLPITFPMAFYRKLLGEPVTELHHIADGWPELANGLTTLLEWNEKDGAVEDIFVLTYEFSTSMFGEPISRQMHSSPTTSWPQFSARPDAAPLAIDNASDAPLVTGDNRNAYVSDYIRYLTEVSVGPQLAALRRGFGACLHAKSLSLLTPALLQTVVEGEHQDVDVAELRRAARYVGWDASHRSVRDFWHVVRRYDNRMRRRLLEFVTASDRVPVGGLAGVQFVVQRNGAEEGEGGHLPTAYTCYGTLLLPEYRDRDVLRERLGMALENAQGFGFA